MFDKISRSWTLAGQCWEVLKGDPALLIFPLLSAAAIALLMASFAIPVWMMYHGLRSALAQGNMLHTTRAVSWAATYVFYVIGYAIVMFFNSAMISVALRRLDGEPASVREGLEAALSNLPAILGYALIAATVGVVLRAIEERVGLIGRIVVAIIGGGWTLASSMVLPVLVVEGDGPVEAISRSLDLLQRNWGENLIGNGGISLGISVIAVPLGLSAMQLMRLASSTRSAGAMALAGVVLVVTFVGLALISATLHAIYTAALYRFATGNKDGGIGSDLLAGAFRQR